MIRIYRNFLNVLQRSRSASILNIMGLSVAFAVFIAILIQVNYEYSYNSSFPKADRIYRLELRHSSEKRFIRLCFLCRGLRLSVLKSLSFQYRALWINRGDRLILPL